MKEMWFWDLNVVPKANIPVPSLLHPWKVLINVFASRPCGWVEVLGLSGRLGRELLLAGKVGGKACLGTL